jgi:large subunit ribosomal protein L5|tara:strand:- start:1889 stop:2452 length:564 start_codon:yes stop_codon:yes gene_type:complete
MGLKNRYQSHILPELRKELGENRSVMSMPRLIKITLNMGVGQAKDDKKLLDYAVRDLSEISGRKPIVTMTKASEAGFKIREGWPIGCKVTLRKERMYDFLENYVSIVCPKMRDFKGYSVKSFDKQGNFNIGVKEQIVFSEIRYDKIDKIRGLDIAISVSAQNVYEAYLLLSKMNMPFRDKLTKEEVA